MRKQNSNRRTGQRAGRRRMPQATEMISHPPQIPSYEVRHGVRLRFISNALFDGAITFQNLLDTILVAASSTAVYDLFYLVKIRRVSVWAIPSLGNATTVSVQFAGETAGLVGDLKIHTDTSMGVQPAHVSARPSARSLASNYQPSLADTAFNLYVPSGAVVDIECSYVSTYGASVAAQNAAVGASAGTIYLRGLDGKATSSTELPPAFIIAQI